MKFSTLLILISISTSLYGQNNLNERITAILKNVVTNQSNPGLTVGVIKDGQVIFHGSRGAMNLSYKLPFNDSTVFGLASVTKQFTSACIGILEHEGYLSVNDDVRKFIPELGFYGDTIRIKNLLNHTSGIRNHNVLLDLKGFDFKHQGYTNRLIEDLMFKQKGINNIPGEKMLYSNTNYVLLALIIKRVSGFEIHEFAENKLFTPLNMSNTFYRNDLETIIENEAISYYKAGKKYKQPKSLTLCVGAGGVKSTISDMAKWSQVFLDPKHNYAFLKSFITRIDTFNNGKSMTHARGMFVSPYKGYSTFNHSGRDFGMRSQFLCVPDLNLGIVIYANTSGTDVVSLSYKVLDLFIKGQSTPQSPKTSYRHSLSSLKQFVGTYQELNSDLRMTVFIENDTLKAQSSFGNSGTPLNSENNVTFSRLDNSSVIYSFAPNLASESHLQVDFGGAIFYFEKVELEEDLNDNLESYAGSYYSKELNVTYLLTLVDNQLILNYPNHKDLVLKEGVSDVFGANRRTKYSFKRNENNTIVAFEVASEGTVKDILFEKVK